MTKQKFIVNRRTWRLHQFEFSVPCSYQECLARLQVLKIELQSQRPNKSGFRPILYLEPSNNTTTSLKMIFENVRVSGTVTQINDDTTSFMGTSELGSSFYIIVIIFVILAIVLAILPFLSAYVMAKPIDIWLANYIQATLPMIKIALAGILLFYLLFRWQVWRAVHRLASAVDY